MGWLELFENDIQQDSEFMQSENDQTKVLVVDDEPNITSTIEKYLSFNNYTVYTAKNGSEALEQIKIYSPRIIITDLLMPGMNGLELLENICQIDSDIQVIMLTGHGDMNSAIKALKSNASDFLIKPVDLEVLMISVQKAERHLQLKDDVKAYTSELEDLFKEVHHSREYLETVLQNSPNATVTYDREGIITSWNEAAEKITGYPKDETLGKQIKDIFVFEKHLVDLYADQNKDLKKQNIVGQIITKSQSMRFISRNANVLFDSENKAIGGIENFYDITEKTKSDRLLEKRYVQVQTINEIGKRVAASNAVGDLIDFIGKRLVTTFFESAKIFFLLYSEEKKKLVLRAASGINVEKILDEYPLGFELKPEDDLIGHVFTDQQSALYPNISRCELFKKGFTKDVFSVFAFPIKSNNKKYGILYIENTEKMLLDDGDIFMMETIAEYLAISLDKIELLEKITNQNTLLEKQAKDLKSALTKVESQKEIIEEQNKTLLNDLKKAGDFQKSLLPEILPKLAKYHFEVSFTPSNQLGGDFYDVFKINERYLGILIADASGHGVSSAMLSAMFKMTLGKYAAYDLNPASVFTKLNHDFCQVLQMGDFFTAFYGIIDLKLNKFIYSNAAHPLPLLYNFDSKKVEELDSEGFLLGVMDNGITYERKAFSFKDRYRLFIYTDGLPEAINSEKVQYGDDKVREKLIKYSNQKPDKFLNTIVNDLQKYTGSKSFDDDLTLMVMDVNIN